MKAGGSKVPPSPTASPASAGSTHRPGQQSALAAARPSRPGAPSSGGGRAGGRARVRAGWTASTRGAGLPYLQQHKESEQRQQAAAAAGARGQVPHRSADGDPERRSCRRVPRGAGWLTMANWGCGLRPRAPRQLPGGACCLSGLPAAALFPVSQPGSSRNVPGAAVLYQLRMERVGGVGEAPPPPPQPEEARVRVASERRGPRPSSPGSLAPAVFSGLRTRKRAAASPPSHQPPPAASNRWAPPQPLPQLQAGELRALFLTPLDQIPVPCRPRHICSQSWS